MLMMHLMRPANCFYITVIAFRKPFKALMNDYIMHQKISNAIQCDARSNAYNPPGVLHTAKHNAEPARNSENEKECIVLFNKMFNGVMMIFTQTPQNTSPHI